MILPSDQDFPEESLPDPEDAWDERFAGLRPEQVVFLRGLEQEMSTPEAASVAGIPLAALHRMRRTDATFAEAWSAVEAAVDYRIEDTAIQLSIHGAKRPVIYKGSIVKDEKGEPVVLREYPIPLIVFMLKTRPTLRDRYVEKANEVERDFAARLRAAILDIDSSIGRPPPAASGRG